MLNMRSRTKSCLVNASDDKIIIRDLKVLDQYAGIHDNNCLQFTVYNRFYEDGKGNNSAYEALLKFLNGDLSTIKETVEASLVPKDFDANPIISLLAEYKDYCLDPIIDQHTSGTDYTVTLKQKTAEHIAAEQEKEDILILYSAIAQVYEGN